MNMLKSVFVSFPNVLLVGVLVVPLLLSPLPAQAAERAGEVVPFLVGQQQTQTYSVPVGVVDGNVRVVLDRSTFTVAKQPEPEPEPEEEDSGTDSGTGAETSTEASTETSASSYSYTSTEGALEAQKYARSVLDDAQYQCLLALWNKESGWDYTAYNASSGATGIPQALPGSKMASAGADWETNPVTQVKWGLSYIESRYGVPCAAWEHSQQDGWY